MPYQTQALGVLTRWREIERALTTVDRGSPESEDLLAEAIRLRDEYRGLISAARRDDAPEPTPFPLNVEPLV